MNQHVKLNRRAFVIGTAAAGAGLAIGLDIPFGGPDVVRAADGSPEVNAWVVIQPDDTVVIRIARSEMGQGTLTGLAQLVAEELECDWSKVTTEFPTPGESVARKRVWGDFSTGGSRGIRTSQDYVRKGGATARVMLIQAAANEWKVPASECSAANSVITHTPSGRSTTYGKVAEAAARLEPPGDVKLKDPKDWKIAGKSLKRLDTPDKTTGATVYGIDVKLPGMLNAAIRDCPVTGGTLKSFDEAKISGMKGVKKVVRVGDSAVAVVADTWWHAKTALDALPVVWDEGPNAKVSSRLDREMARRRPRFRTGLCRQQDRRRARPPSPAPPGRSKRSTTIPTRTTRRMEPLNATALYTADKCEVWCGTQNGEAAFAAALEESGLPANKVDVHKQMLGGGFGRRGQTDYVRQAVAIAKQMPGTPIKLLWSREEDMQHGRYHPITQCKMTGAFDADNNLVALHMRISGQSILARAAPRGHGQRHGSRDIRRPCPEGRRRVRLWRSQSADRTFDAQPAYHPGLLARRERQPERALCGMLHGRTGACRGAGPARVPSQAAGPASEEPRRARCGCRKDRLGQAGAARRLSRPRAEHGLWQLCRGGGGNLRHRRQQDQGASHRRRHRSRLCRQSGADRAPDRRLLRLRADRRCSTAAAP